MTLQYCNTPLSNTHSKIIPVGNKPYRGDNGGYQPQILETSRITRRADGFIGDYCQTQRMEGRRTSSVSLPSFEGNLSRRCEQVGGYAQHHLDGRLRTRINYNLKTQRRSCRRHGLCCVFNLGKDRHITAETITKLFPTRRGVVPVVTEQTGHDVNGNPFNIQIEPCHEGFRLIFMHGQTMDWTQRFMTIHAAIQFADRRMFKVNEKLQLKRRTYSETWLNDGVTDHAS